MHKLYCGDNLDKLDLVEDNSIDFIYIDPPYGILGKKGNKYSDYFNSHKEWQDFLKPRLEKGRNKLKETGSISVSIDNTNLAYLILTLNEVFNEKNFINTFIWIKQKTNKNGVLNTDHEYIVAYARNIKKVVVNKQVLDVENDTRYKYTDERANYFLQPNSNIQSAYGGGINDNPIEINTYWNQTGEVMGMGVGNNSEPNRFANEYATHGLDNDGSTPSDYKEPISINTYALGQSEVDKALDYKSGNKQQSAIEINSYSIGSAERSQANNEGRKPTENTFALEQETILIYPRTSWRWCKEKIDWAMKENLVVFKKNKNNQWKVYFKQYRYLTTAKIKGQYCLVPIERTKPYSTIIEDCTNDRILAKIFGSSNKFHYSKPVKLIEHLLDIFTKPNDIVLDFFAGSGTTTHAAHNKGRNSISIQNNENNIFDDILIKRLDYCKINYEI